MLPKQNDKKYTYADYLNLSKDENYELIEGTFWDMSPAPNSNHQLVSARMGRKLGNFLDGKPCQEFYAPFDVFFSDDSDIEDEEIDTVVQPDISVICDRSKIVREGCIGAPDLIVEIWSPSTGYKDNTLKLSLYERQGVKEYWVINPERKSLEIFNLDGVTYGKPRFYYKDETAISKLLEGFSISLPWLFADF